MLTVSVQMTIEGCRIGVVPVSLVMGVNDESS